MWRVGSWMLLWAAIAAAGCGHHEAEHAHGHKAAHGGCLNVVGSCELGHAEVVVEGDMLKCWFVGGGNNTNKAVRVPDAEIVLTVEGDPAKTITLKAKPIELADEKVGDCSFFAGQADWLRTAKQFEAIGSVTLKGAKREFRIRYPGGFDPEHEAGHKQKDHK